MKAGVRGVSVCVLLIRNCRHAEFRIPECFATCLNSRDLCHFDLVLYRLGRRKIRRRFGAYDEFVQVERRHGLEEYSDVPGSKRCPARAVLTNHGFQ
ncbi:hypothetical protein HYQ46_013014 [Verticillium longisporum]|nr:hypothetical protein HYQ46_013014 [Verticillium longisporum]